MAPDHKTQKYDRQLRLWHAHGQAALEKAHVCLVNGTATGTEALKNLVLPGVGAFTVIDAAKVSPDDVGNNFFVTRAHLGQPRAKVVTALLQELNDDVLGHYIDDDITPFVAAHPRYFDRFSLVLITGHVPAATLLALDRVCWPRGIPLLVVKACGFVSTLRVVTRAHHIVESHPDTPVRDLRLADPFPELVAFVDTFKPFEDMTSSELTHVPYPVILLRLWREWRANNQDTPAREFRKYAQSEKDRHAARLTEAALKSLDANQSDMVVASAAASAADMENWDEALKQAFLAYTPTSVPRNVKDVLEHAILDLSANADAADEHAPETNNSVVANPVANVTAGCAWPPTFWALCAALKSFVADHGRLPVRGSVPDMKADTATYVSLQRVYRDKAAADAADLHARLRAIAVPVVATSTPTASSASLSRSSSVGPSPATSPGMATADAASMTAPALQIEAATNIDLATVTEFARHAATLHVLSTPSLHDEYARAHPHWTRALSDDPGMLSIYVVLRAREVFYARQRRWPGAHAADADADTARLRSAARDVVKALVTGGGNALVMEAAEGSADAHAEAGIVTPVAPAVDVDDWVQECVRAGPAELAAVAGYMGGVIAQEAIKLITAQYVPMMNTYVYDGIHSKSEVLKA
ncbi:NEDD8-activating enzyme E1 regulatory subunit [Allomyces arbusculus]|nr:NEDD8-activating enzyme E1 regulatory subunit [Allomyces arbusculus]